MQQAYIKIPPLDLGEWRWEKTGKTSYQIARFILAQAHKTIRRSARGRALSFKAGRFRGGSYRFDSARIEGGYLVLQFTISAQRHYFRRKLS